MVAIFSSYHQVWKLLYFDDSFTNKPSTGPDNYLPPNMGQPMIWKSTGLICWSIYASLGLRELDENPVKMPASKTNTPQFFTVSNEQPLSINDFAFANRNIVCFVLKESILIASVMLPPVCPTRHFRAAAAGQAKVNLC